MVRVVLQYNEHNERVPNTNAIIQDSVSRVSSLSADNIVFTSPKVKMFTQRRAVRRAPSCSVY